MGRTVESIGKNVIYFDCTEYNELDYEDLILNLQSSLTHKFKSLERVKDKWVQYPYRENRIILENQFVQVSISEYCGCGAISIFINDKYADEKYGTLAESWLNKNFVEIENVISQYVDTMGKVATFSNGETIYKKK